MNDIYAFVLIFINALDRPRGLDEQIVKVLYRDGLTLFIVCLYIRFAFYATAELLFFVSRPDRTLYVFLAFQRTKALNA